MTKHKIIIFRNVYSRLKYVVYFICNKNNIQEKNIKIYRQKKSNRIA